MLSTTSTRCDSRYAFLSDVHYVAMHQYSFSRSLKSYILYYISIDKFKIVHAIYENNDEKLLYLTFATHRNDYHYDPSCQVATGNKII